MAIQTLWPFDLASPGGEVVGLLDYDTVAETVGSTITGESGTGLTCSATWTLIDAATNTVIAAVNCDQFKVNGQNDGQRHILAGPGAAGRDTSGKALPTKGITAQQVARVSTPGSVNPTLLINPQIAGL